MVYQMASERGAAIFSDELSRLYAHRLINNVNDKAYLREESALNCSDSLLRLVLCVINTMNKRQSGLARETLLLSWPLHPFSQPA